MRARYNGRQFLSWLKDLDDKYEKIKVMKLVLMKTRLFKVNLTLSCHGQKSDSTIDKNSHRFAMYEIMYHWLTIIYRH